MIRAVTLAALLLAGCDSPEPPDRDLADLETRIAELETEVGDLRAELDRESEARDRLLDAAVSDANVMNDEIARLSDNDTALQDNIDYLGRYHGVPPARRR